jgi:Predicted pyridoxal phosphate-dependent enzyme apparently involved in regulation of cell wall biogenesis
MSAPIPMVDPAAEYRSLQAEIDAAVRRVLSSGRYVLGPEGEGLERELGAYVGVPHAVGCNSGTDALHLALVAAGIAPGDEVVLPAFTFFATAEAVSYTGATPVFADIDARTFNLSADALSKRLTPKTRAVIVVHLFGQCAAMDEIASLCQAKNLVLVEDCAQAIGAEYQGRRAGSWGDFGCFSFYPTKNLAAAGDAGLITTRSADYDKLLRMLRHHGSRQTYLHERVGWNSRLDELQAAVLRVKLAKLEQFNAARRRVAQKYQAKLKDTPLQLPLEDARGKHVYHQYTIRSERRDTLREALAQGGIASSVFYPMPLHRQPAYEQFHRALALPASEAAARSVLSLPINPLLDDPAVERICARLREALR